MRGWHYKIAPLRALTAVIVTGEAARDTAYALYGSSVALLPTGEEATLAEVSEASGLTKERDLLELLSRGAAVVMFHPLT